MVHPLPKVSIVISKKGQRSFLKIISDSRHATKCNKGTHYATWYAHTFTGGQEGQSPSESTETVAPTPVRCMMPERRETSGLQITFLQQAWVLQYDSNSLMAWTDRKNWEQKITWIQSWAAPTSWANVWETLVGHEAGVAASWSACPGSAEQLCHCRYTHTHTRPQTHPHWQTHTYSTNILSYLAHFSVNGFINKNILTCKISQYIFNSKQRWY